MVIHQLRFFGHNHCGNGDTVFNSLSQDILRSRDQRAM